MSISCYSGLMENLENESEMKGLRERRDFEGEFVEVLWVNKRNECLLFIFERNQWMRVVGKEGGTQLFSFTTLGVLPHFFIHPFRKPVSALGYTCGASSFVFVTVSFMTWRMVGMESKWMTWLPQKRCNDTWSWFRDCFMDTQKHNPLFSRMTILTRPSGSVHAFQEENTKAIHRMGEVMFLVQQDGQWVT